MRINNQLNLNQINRLENFMLTTTIIILCITKKEDIIDKHQQGHQSYGTLIQQHKVYKFL